MNEHGRNGSSICQPCSDMGEEEISLCSHHLPQMPGSRADSKVFRSREQTMSFTTSKICESRPYLSSWQQDGLALEGGFANELALKMWESRNAGKLPLVQIYLSSPEPCLWIGPSQHLPHLWTDIVHERGQSYTCKSTGSPRHSNNRVSVRFQYQQNGRSQRLLARQRCFCEHFASREVYRKSYTMGQTMDSILWDTAVSTMRSFFFLL